MPDASEQRYNRLVALAHRRPDDMIRQIKAAQIARPGGLRRFVEMMWPAVEPARKFVPGWHIDAICDHLEAVSNGEIKRLLVNVPPGTSKSLITNVFFPAWEWTRQPHLRYLCFSYSQTLTIRDNVRFRQLIQSPEYKEIWGRVFDKSEDQFSLITVMNNKTGFKVASSVTGTSTGARADRLLIDDPNNAAEAESEVIREGANMFFREVLPSRLANPAEGAIVVIQQRVHQSDVSGTILDNDMGYVHLMIPMRNDGNPRETVIGWRDPRCFDRNGDYIGGEGDLMWPAMYPAKVVDQLQKDLGNVAFAGQYQQIPVPRGGAIFETAYWNDWPSQDFESDNNWLTPEGKIMFPQFEYIVAAVDTAFTEKQENDFSACIILGVFRGATTKMASPTEHRNESDPVEFLRIVHDDRPKVMLIFGWNKRVALHGPPEQRPLGVSDREWVKEWRTHRQQSWGLVEWVADTCKRYKVDHLIIETQAQGHGLEQELRRLHSDGDWGVELKSARGKGNGKVERAWAVQHLFSNSLVYCPKNPKTGLRPQWAEDIVNQSALFPRGRHDDLVDALILALQHLRDTGILVRGDEHDADYAETLLPKQSNRPLYEV